MALMDPATWTDRIYSGGWVTPAGGSYPVVEPATGEELGRLGLADAEDVKRATARAASAQPEWARTSYEARALPSHPYGRLLPSAQERFSFARRLPSGVVGVIAPFNFPVILSIRSVAPALALGNAVVLKPDPRTAVCGGVSLAAVFEEAGLPDGVLHV